MNYLSSSPYIYLNDFDFTEINQVSLQGKVIKVICKTFCSFDEDFLECKSLAAQTIVASETLQSAFN